MIKLAADNSNGLWVMDYWVGKADGITKVAQVFGWEECESSQDFWDSNRDVSASVKQFTPSHLPWNVNHSSCMYVLRLAQKQESVCRDCELSSLRFCWENIPPNHIVDKSRPPGCALVKSKRGKNDLAEALCAYWHHIGHYSGGNLFQGPFPPYALRSTSDSDLKECHNRKHNSLRSYQRGFMWHGTSSKQTLLLLWLLFFYDSAHFPGDSKFLIYSDWVLEI